MSNLGISVMLNMLTSNEPTVTAVRASIGKEIKSVNLENEELRFVFTDDTNLYLWDDGQSCCESRYMRTDDNLQDFIGAKVISFELKDAPEIEDKYGSHEVQFLEVKTDKGSFVMSNHNEHNGYYGGFAIKAKL